jgi:hypothetical protein
VWGAGLTTVASYVILIFKERKASKEPEGTDPKRVNPGQTTGFESIKVGEKINPDDDPKGKGTKAPPGDPEISS